MDAGIIPPDIDKFNEAWELSHGTVKLLDLGVELPVPLNWPGMLETWAFLWPVPIVKRGTTP